MTVSSRRTVGYYLCLEVLQYDSGFTAMSSGVRVPSEFAVHTVLEIALCTAAVVMYRNYDKAAREACIEDAFFASR